MIGNTEGERFEFESIQILKNFKSTRKIAQFYIRNAAASDKNMQI